MLRLMIVDDERAIREAIRSSIPWEELGIAVTGVYRNGVEAYDAILDEYPDIVLTDIKMPGLSGLELVARVTEAQLDTQFVILSGYAEFEFAKEAMRFGIRHYLLKPTNPEQIIGIMKEVCEACYQKRRLSALEHRHRRLAADIRHALMYGILTAALSTDEPLEDIIERNSQFLDVSNVNYELCTFFYTEQPDVERCMRLIEALHRKWGDGAALHVIYVNLALIIFFESYTGDYTELDAALAALPGSGSQTEYKRLSFPSLTGLLRHLIPRLLRFDTVRLLNGERSVELNNFSRLMRACDGQVGKLLEAGEPGRGAVLENISQLLSSIEDIRFLRLVASGMLMKFASLCGGPHAVIDSAVRTGFERTDNPAQLRETLIEKLSALSACRSAQDTAEEPELVRQIKRYVTDNLACSELSLKWLAENHLYMNVDYVSKQFALKTGEKFSAYLSRMRIERARELLLAGGAGHIYEVAAKVGCGNNPQYFSQIFKRAIGMTPSEYIHQQKTG